MQANTFYNEIDPYAAQWLRNLIEKKLVQGGIVDTRTIHDINGSHINQFSRAHFFAGIGGWDLALRLAGWPSDRPVWTGSCPCQPFSAAGKGLGLADPRHLWPEFFRLIRECRPGTVFGEQVGSQAGLDWLDGVRADLEGEGYAFWAMDLCAASVNAPHIRQRLFWVANAQRDAGEPRRAADQSGESLGAAPRRAHAEPGRRGLLGGMADADGFGRQGDQWRARPGEEPVVAGSGDPGWLGDTSGQGLARPSRQRGDDGQECSAAERAGRDGHPTPVWMGHPDSRGPAPRGLAAAADGYGGAVVADGGPWSTFRLVGMLDGKTRRIGSEIFPLAHGVPARVGKLRASGNAIVPQVAAEFIRAYLESEVR